MKILCSNVPALVGPSHPCPSHSCLTNFDNSRMKGFTAKEQQEGPASLERTDVIWTVFIPRIGRLYVPPYA